MLETDISEGVPYNNHVHVPRIPLVGTMLSDSGIRSRRYQKTKTRTIQDGIQYGRLAGTRGYVG